MISGIVKHGLSCLGMWQLLELALIMHQSAKTRVRQARVVELEVPPDASLGL